MAPVLRNLTRMAASEVRHDALSGRIAIVATGREARPHQFRSVDAVGVDNTADCPFCPGHESMTPPEICRTGAGAPGEPGWRVRVFPNLYPITDAHEVVVISPDHHRSFGQLADADAVEVLAVLRDRVRARLDSGHAAAVAILNHKREAGASLPHPHAQVVAMDFVPPEIQAAQQRAHDADGDLVVREASAPEALVFARGLARAWCPPASTSPFLVRVADVAAGARFDDAGDDTIAAVALITRDTLAGINTELDDPPYNLVVHSAVPTWPGPFHWYVELTPRLAVIAGFEMATGVFVNTVDPARAATALRAAWP
jgi:UDPglucose--hexose-1-phosphate uridylyltransferase